MKKLFNSIRSKVNNLTARAVVAVSNAKAEGYVDSGVKILIAVVIGALLLSGLYALFNTTIMPTVTAKIRELFNYAGSSTSITKKVRGHYSMKKLFNSIRSKVNDMATRAIVAVSNAKAEGYVDSGVKILIAVVIGALLLSGLYALFNGTIMPTVTRRITELFNYKG